MGVVIKGKGWKYVGGFLDCQVADIELIPPTSEELRELANTESNSSVLVVMSVTEALSRCRTIIGIPSPEPQRGLPERLTEDAKYQDLINAINKTNDYLKAQKGEG